jgi:GAF domain-containing protein
MSSTTHEPSALTAAVLSALADVGPADQEMLDSIVGLVRTTFGAAASSICLIEQATGELVFEAVSGEGESFLIGSRNPTDRGIAGWVATTGEPVAVDNLAQNPLFAKDLAERTRFVPEAILAVPITYRSEILGVLQVLDPHPQARSSLANLDLLAMFADQAGLSLHALVRSRTAHETLTSDGADFGPVAALVRVVTDMDPDRRGLGFRLIGTLAELLAPRIGVRPGLN